MSPKTISTTFSVPCDAVGIPLDAQPSSSLDWKEAIHLAEQAIAEDKQLFWHIDLGLFHALARPLSDPMQEQTLCLALDHFRDSIYDRFADHTLGVSIYQGPLEMLQEISPREYELWLSEKQLTATPWAESCFKADLAAGYLERLLSSLPAMVEPFLFLDLKSAQDPFLAALLLYSGRFESFRIALANSPFPVSAHSWLNGPAYGWSFESEGEHRHPPFLGILIPGDLLHPEESQELGDALRLLSQKNVPFRLIPESQLTHLWDGLDLLLCSSKCLTREGMRMLQGFCAAGGTVISADQPLDLPQVLDYQSWVKSL